MKKNAMLILTSSVLIWSSASAADYNDGMISTNEYTWNTNIDSSKWNSQKNTGSELGDASGGDEYDIEFLGFEIEDGKFKFGLEGGHIVTGLKTGRSAGHDIYLGDIAISINQFSNPVVDSSAFDFAIRLNADNNSFSILQAGTDSWSGADIYNRPDHVTSTYQMTSPAASSADLFTINWSNTGSKHVVEGEFDLSLLNFDSNMDNDISAYLTMTCVNDEAWVNGHIAAVPEPSTYALMIGGLGLVGLMAARRKKA